MQLQVLEAKTMIMIILLIEINVHTTELYNKKNMEFMANVNTSMLDRFNKNLKT